MAASEAKNSESVTIGQRLDSAIETTREKISQATQNVKERLEHGRESVKESVEDIKKKSLEDVITSTKDFAKNHPGTTLLGGIALGFVIGYFFRRKD